jgi:transposase
MVEYAILVGMYLRTTQRKNRDGTTVTYYQLAHNIRRAETKTPVAEVIHNFGRADQLDREELVRLCRSIARICGVVIHDPFTSPHQGREAGLPKEVRYIQTMELGIVGVIEALWERLGIGETLRKLCKGKGCIVPYERALFAMVANRLCEPESKLGVWDRWLEKVYMPSCKGLKLAQMYEAMDVLHEHKEAVEETVFFHTANLMNLEVDLIFYDTTTVSFSIDYEDEDEDEGGEGMRKFGYSPTGTWAPQVVVALAVTREGLPVRSWVFPGNTSGIQTIKKVRADLKGWKLGRALFVADSGMNSEENRQQLARACGKYLFATRMGSVKEIKETVLSHSGRYKVLRDNLHAKEVIVGDGERRRRYIVCYNPKEAKKQRTHRKGVVQELEEELKKHPDHNAKAQWAIELLASGRYKRYLSIDKDNRICMDKAAIREAEQYDGKWVLQTNDDTISLEDAACGYKSLMVIERCFHTLKRTRIKMEPLYHWLPRRIETHVKICVLALLIERVIELQCEQPWAKIRETLHTLKVSEFTSATFQFFQRNEAKPEVSHAFKTLAIPLPKQVLHIASRT